MWMSRSWSMLSLPTRFPDTTNTISSLLITWIFSAGSMFLPAAAAAATAMSIGSDTIDTSALPSPRSTSPPGRIADDLERMPGRLLHRGAVRIDDDVDHGGRACIFTVSARASVAKPADRIAVAALTTSALFMFVSPLPSGVVLTALADRGRFLVEARRGHPLREAFPHVSCERWHRHRFSPSRLHRNHVPVLLRRFRPLSNSIDPRRPDLEPVLRGWALGRRSARGAATAPSEQLGRPIRPLGWAMP